MNEKWVLCCADLAHNEVISKNNSRIEFQFNPDGTFNYNGKHTNAWFSSAIGTYHYQHETDEVFIQVESGGFDWLQQPAFKGKPALYWGEIYSDYQLYFKVIERSDSTITVMEYINSYHEDIPKDIKTYDKSPIWINVNGKYSLIVTYPNRTKERRYATSINTQ